jgi:predicted component of type VI protein secretion system
MTLNAKLVVVGGDVKTAEIKLRLPASIGRGRGTTIMLPHPLVSRQHCELFETEGRLMVRDLGSLNGTFVNNERINEAPLAPGELLTVGTVTFRAVYDENGAAPAFDPSAKTVEAAGADGTIRKGPPSNTVRAQPGEPVDLADVDLEDIDELGEDPELEGEAASGQTPSFFDNTASAPSANTDPSGDLGAGPPAAQAIPTAARSAPPAVKPAPKAIPAPLVKPMPAAAPPAARSAPPVPPAAPPPAPPADEIDEDAQEEEDDLNDFLKSLK